MFQLHTNKVVANKDVTWDSLIYRQAAFSLLFWRNILLRSFPVRNHILYSIARNETKGIPRRIVSGRGTQWPQLHCTLGRRVTRIPGSTHGARSRHSSQSDTLVRVQGIRRKQYPRNQQASSPLSRLSREKSVTHFGFPVRRHRAPFASFYRIPRGNEIPTRGFCGESAHADRGGKGQRVP